jgi:hypothetical protein
VHEWNYLLPVDRFDDHHTSATMSKPDFSKLVEIKIDWDAPPITRFENSENGRNCHCWVVHNGAIVDYPNEFLTNFSMGGSPDVRRVPFAFPLQLQIFEVLRSRHKELMKRIRKSWKGNKEGYQRNIEENYNAQDINAFRAFHYYAQHHSDGAKLVIGALGFAGEDGSVYYELGGMK